MTDRSKFFDDGRRTIEPFGDRIRTIRKISQLRDAKLQTRSPSLISVSKFWIKKNFNLILSPIRSMPYWDVRKNIYISSFDETIIDWYESIWIPANRLHSPIFYLRTFRFAIWNADSLTASYWIRSDVCTRPD